MNDEELVRLRRIAQDLADRWGEPCLICTDPPPSSIHRVSYEPYVVLLSQASREELASPVERVEPRRKSWI